MTGNARVGQHLVVSPGSWASLNRLTYSYQWERCTPGATRFNSETCAPIPGATSNTYDVSLADQGSRIAALIEVRDTRGINIHVATHVSAIVSH